MDGSVEGVSPGRVNLLGEHTDYNGGLCLPFNVPLRTRARLVPRPDRWLRLRSTQLEQTWEGALDDLAPGSVPGWAGYAAGVLWALREEPWELPGLDVAVDGGVPVGAGLSSSAALTASVAVAAATLTGHGSAPAVRDVLVRACRRAETEMVGAPTGGMDQHSVLHCPAGHALLLDFADATRRPVPLPLAEDGLLVLVVDTRVEHSNAAGGYAERRAECERGVPRRLRHVRSENERVRRAVAAVGERDWAALGRLLTESHESLRDDFEVSTPELDAAVTAALRAGALGARMTGGGFGGSAIALVERDAADAVGAGVVDAFADVGFTEPALHPVVPVGPAAAARGP